MTARASLPETLKGKWKFGRLTILRDAEDEGRYATPPDRKVGPRRVIARCECGDERSYDLRNIRRGLTTSCGCYLAETARERASRQPRIGNRFAKMTAVIPETRKA